MLEEDRIAADRWIEDPDPDKPLKREQQDRDRDHRCAEDHHKADRIHSPYEQRQSEPCHPRCTHRVNRDDKVQSRQDRRKSIYKDPQTDGHDVRIRKRRTVRRVKRPTSVDAALQESVDRECSTDPINIEAQQIDPRQRKVLCSDHYREQEIAENGGYGWNEEKEDHQHAVLGKDLVVRAAFQQIARRRQ